MSVKYNMQLYDWPVYRDLVMTSPYDDVIIHKLQYATTSQKQQQHDKSYSLLLL